MCLPLQGKNLANKTCKLLYLHSKGHVWIFPSFFQDCQWRHVCIKCPRLSFVVFCLLNGRTSLCGGVRRKWEDLWLKQKHAQQKGINQRWWWVRITSLCSLTNASAKQCTCTMYLVFTVDNMWCTVKRIPSLFSSPCGSGDQIFVSIAQISVPNQLSPQSVSQGASQSLQATLRHQTQR